MPLPQPKPGIMDIPLYEAGKSQVAGAVRVIKLSSNEAALGPSPKARAAYAAVAAGVNRYPSPDSADLRAALGAVHGLDPSRIVCGVGSDELLCLLARAYAGPGDEVIYSRHGFAMYPIYTRAVGATPVVAPETDLTTDVEAILAAVTPRTRLVFLANPNNPTGTYISGGAVRRLRAGLKDDIVLVLDEAYAEFVEAPDYETGFALVRETENTVVLRTFSKIYGLAGLRLGWGFAPASIVAVLERLRSPFNVSLAAQAAGVAAVKDRDHLAAARAHNSKWRAIALQRLRGLGFPTRDSQGNFLLPEFPKTPGRTAADCDAFLQARGLIVRRVDVYELPNYLRITIGTEEEMTLLLDALADFAGGKHA